VIQLQHDYITKAKEAINISGDAISAIARLDYCIPGPNPNWQSNTTDAQGSFIQAQTGDADIQGLFAEYDQKIQSMYGSTSAMQTPGTSDYLSMASLGLNLTKDLGAYHEIMLDKKKEYQDSITNTNATIQKLNVIKEKVNLIITAAQKRRDAARTQSGAPKVSAMCLATEKVTYLEGDVLK
jgi:hypothetical protein